MGTNTRRYVAILGCLILVLLQTLVRAERPSATQPAGFTDAQWRLAAAIVSLQPRTETLLSTEKETLREIQHGKIVKENPGPPYRRNADGSYIFYGGYAAGKKIRDSLANKSKEKIKLLEERIASLKAGAIILPYFPLDNAHVGDIGRPKFRDFDKDPDFIVGKIFQIVSANEMIVRFGMFGDFWVKGYSTESLVDGKGLQFDKAVIVSGTKKYETITGTRTIFMLEPVSDENIQVAVKYLRGHSSSGN